MMKNRFYLWGVVLLFLAQSAFATGINVYIHDDAFKNQTGGALQDSNYHIYPAKPSLEFFNSLPNPNEAGTLLGDPSATGGSYAHVGAEHKYQYSSLNGGTFFIRAWSGTQTPGATILNQGKYYGKTSNPIASGTTLPFDWHIRTIQTDYLADIPHAPSIGTISEALNRSGAAYALTLTIPVSYSEGSPKIEKANSSPSGKSFRVLIRKEGESFLPDDAPVNGTTVIETDGSITATGAYFTTGKYYLRARAYNWYGSGPWSVEVPYETLSSSAGGEPTAPEIVDITLKKNPTGMGINAVGIPFAPYLVVKGDKAIDKGATIQNLLDAINEVGKPDSRVTSISYWDNTRDSIEGAWFSADGSGNTKNYNKDFVLSAGSAVQISVSGPISFQFKKK